MGSLQSAQIKSNNAHEHSERIVADGPVGLRLRYTGKGTITSVIVTAATDIVLTTSDATETFAFSSFTTMGDLAEAINNSLYWDCQLLDALRSDASASKLVAGTLAATSAGYYNVMVDTSALKAITYRCTYERDKYGKFGSIKPKGAHRVHLREIKYYATLGAAAANGLRIYEYDPVLQSETQVYQATSVSATATTVNFASGEQVISSNWGNDLIVRIVDGSSVADSALYLEASYKAE